MQLPKGIPFYDCIDTVFALLEGKPSVRFFAEWLVAIVKVMHDEVVADFRTPQRSREGSAGEDVIRMVSVWVSESRSGWRWARPRWTVTPTGSRHPLAAADAQGCQVPAGPGALALAGPWPVPAGQQRRGGRFGDELVDAAADMLNERWQPDPRPEWLTCVPSMRHPRLLPEYAERLAGALQLPFEPIVRKARQTQPQKLQDNSFHQCRNLDGAFEIHGEVPPGAVLLVDDVVDSRWTLTLVAALLLHSGSGPVWPLALAASWAGVDRACRRKRTGHHASDGLAWEGGQGWAEAPDRFRMASARHGPAGSRDGARGPA